MKLYDTNMPQNYSKGLFEEYGCNLGYNHTDKIANVTAMAMAHILNGLKDKNTPAVFKFVRADGSMIAAGIIRFFENPDADNPGNWNIVATFDEEDIPENAKIVTNQNPDTHVWFRSVAGDTYHFTYQTPADVINLSNYLFEQTRKWLDENAKENEEVSIDFEHVMKCRVAVEGGEKVFAIDLDGEIKMLIKDDAAIEK